VNPLALLGAGKWLLYGALAAGVLLGIWRLDVSRQAIGYSKAQAEYTAAALKASEAARAKEQALITQTATITKAKDAKIANINSRLVVALGELRNRPERRDSAAVIPADCKSATGAELSRPDAGFLIGEATRADTLRAGLKACYTQYDALTGK